MKILFIGNFQVDYCTEVHHKKTLEKMGHEVVTVQENTATIEEIFSKLDGVSMLIHTHTHSWHIKDIAQVYRTCKERGIPTVGYHLDLWLGIQREKDLSTDPYWNIEYFFSVDKLMVDYLNERSEMPEAFFLPAGVFEDECYLGEFKEDLKCDVLFVGSRGYHPEWPYRKQLIEWLEKEYGNRFKQYGGGGLGTIRGKDLNDLYASAKVVVGDTLCKGFNYPYYLSDRIFETTGRGGFIIHPYIKGLEDLFVLNLPHTKKEDLEKGVELITYDFNNFSGLKDSIDFFIEMNETREAIRLRGFERTKKEHTYTNRLSYVIDTIFK